MSVIIIITSICPHCVKFFIFILKIKEEIKRVRNIIREWGEGERKRGLFIYFYNKIRERKSGECEITLLFLIFFVVIKDKMSFHSLLVYKEGFISM